MDTKVRLRKIWSNRNDNRFDEVIGYLLSDLQLGSSIVISEDPVGIQFGHQGIVTTPIIKIDGDRYHTKNSIYEIKKYKLLELVQ